jgi:hypothetical protein
MAYHELWEVNFECEYSHVIATLMRPILRHINAPEPAKSCAPGQQP